MFFELNSVPTNRWHCLRFCFVMTMGFTLFLSWQTSLHAQEEGEQVVEAVEFDDPEMDFEEDEGEVMAAQVFIGQGNEPAKLLAAKKFELNQIFAVDIEQVNRICQLDKKQLFKLKIGAKGAVKTLATKWQKEMGQFGVAQFGGQVDDDEDNDEEELLEVEEIVFKDADEIDENTMQMVMMGGMGNPFNTASPVDSRFWQKAIANVLNDEQELKLKQYRIVQAAAKRKGLIDASMVSITYELGLTAEQLPKFDSIVRPSMEKADINCPVFYESYVLYYYASKADSKQLKKILSPPQLQKWKLFLAPAKQIGQMMDMEAGGVMAAGFESGAFIVFASSVDEFLVEFMESLVSTFDGFAKQ